MFLVVGLLFNKYRIFSIILASIPMLLISATYLLIPENFVISKIAWAVAVLFIILSGLFLNYHLKKLEKELSQQLLENHLIEND